MSNSESHCKSQCDCDGPDELLGIDHSPDCHSRAVCDEGRYCDKHFDEATQENAWMLGVPLSALTGVMSEQDKQDIRDAGRGHLLP